MAGLPCWSRPLTDLRTRGRATLLVMGWVAAAARWALIVGTIGVLLVVFGGADDPGWFVAMVAGFGGLLGIFWHHRDRVDDREDAALRAAARLPTTAGRAEEWIDRLREGRRVKIRGAFATLTADGIEWTGLRKGSIRWGDVEFVAPWTASVRGVRSTRQVRLRAQGKVWSIACTKRNFADVLATCSEMARTAT